VAPGTWASAHPTPLLLFELRGDRLRDDLAIGDQEGIPDLRR
jgi:hypothetical protein